MPKILYGVQGEGMGHATRSKVVIDYLLKKKYDVRIVASNRAYKFLKKSFPKIKTYELPAFNLIYENNELKQFKSFLNMAKPSDGKKSVEIVKKVLNEFKPDLIISDYEPTTSYLSKLDWKIFKIKKTPLICIDNIHMLSNCHVYVPEECEADYLVAKYTNKIVIPQKNVDRYLVTTFFYPDIKLKKTMLIPSLLREKIVMMKRKTSEREHIVVYQTSKSNTAMFDILKKFDREKFIIYGFNEFRKDKNLTFKKFSEDGFIKDLASCKAAITNGGFSLMSECVFFHKPVLSIPVKHHFEQICNAMNLQRQGYGEYHEVLTRQVLASFLYNVPKYKKNLKRYKQNNNNLALKIIEQEIKKLIKKTGKK